MLHVAPHMRFPLSDFYLEFTPGALSEFIDVVVGEKKHNDLGITGLPIAARVYGFFTNECFKLTPDWTLE